MSWIGAVLRVGEEGDHDLRSVAQEAALLQRELHRLHSLRLAGAVHTDLDGRGDIAGKVLGGIVGSAQDRRGRRGARVKASSLAAGAETGQPRLTAVPRSITLDAA